MTILTLLAAPLAALAMMMLTAGFVLVRTPSRQRVMLYLHASASPARDAALRPTPLREMLPHLFGAWEAIVSLTPLRRKGHRDGRLEPWLTRQLVRADLAITPRELALITMGVMAGGAATGFLLWGTPAMSTVAAVASLVGLVFYVRHKQARRLRAFGEQLPEVLSVFIISLRAGHSTMQALDAISKQVRAPASVELATVVREVHLGISPEQALRHLARRVNNEDLHLLINAMAIQHETGGNLIDMVETIGETVRERVKLRGEVQALTAQASMGSWIVSLLPVVLGGFLFAINPAGISFFWSNWLGVATGSVAVFNIVAGNLILRRMTKIEL